MARGFNLTAEINLRGPSNIRTVVADIRRQLGTVTANVDIRINPAAGRTINTLNQSLQRLNTSLQATRTLSNQAVSALNSLASVGSRVSSTISTLPRNIQSASTAVNTLTRNTNNVTQATQQARTEFEEFGRQSALAVRRFAAFALGTSAIVKLNNAISSGVREFIAFDRELVRVSQVTGTSVKNLDSLVSKITSLSTSLGVTSEDLISVSSTLAQAGLTARDTEKALRALALSALAPSFDSLKDTVEGSIALMRQFGISAGDLEKALGSVNAVAAKFAVESGDIITAIQRTGGVFAAASRGVSEGTDALNQFIAVFTSIRATTRESAETIATGLRTIFTRIQRGDTIDTLKQYGVVLTDLEGKFVGPYEAVRRLAEGLNQLDPRDLRFSRIVEELGGFRQIGKVIPLIQQFTTAQQALIVAQRGQGSLATDAAVAQQSLANKLSKVREEFVALIRSVSQSQSFQNFVDLSLSLATGLIRVADAAKSVLPALTAIAAIRGASFLTQFATGFYGGMRRADQPRRFAAGGYVPGTGNRDTVPAMLTPGEFVIRKRAVEKIGVGSLARLNRNNGGPVQHFEIGGEAKKKRGIDWKSLSKGRGKKGARGPRGRFDLPQPGDAEFAKWQKEIYAEYDADPSLTRVKYNGIPMPPEIAYANQLISEEVFGEYRRKKSGKLKKTPLGLFISAAKMPRGPRAPAGEMEKIMAGYQKSPEFQKETSGAGSSLFSTLKGPLASFKKGGTFGGVIAPGSDNASKIKGALERLLAQSSGQDAIKAKTALDKFDSFIAGGTPEKPGHVSHFTWAMNQIFKKGIATFAEGGSVEEQILSNLKGSDGRYRFGIAALRSGTKQDSKYRMEQFPLDLTKKQKGKNKQDLSGPSGSGLISDKKIDVDLHIGTLSSIANKTFSKGIEKEIVGQLQRSMIVAAQNIGQELGIKTVGASEQNKILSGTTLSSAVGSVYEGALGLLGSPYIDKTESIKSIDFPRGMGPLAEKFFGSSALSEMPTDATRTYAGAGKNASDFKKQIKRFIGALNRGEFTKAENKQAQKLAARAFSRSPEGKALKVIEEAWKGTGASTKVKEALTSNKIFNQVRALVPLPRAFGSNSGTFRKTMQRLYQEDEAAKQGKYAGPITSSSQRLSILESVATAFTAGQIPKKKNLGGIIQKFADGGSAEDKVPALLTPGEFVINKRAAKSIGSARLNKLNHADKIKGFNKGGSVGFVQKFAKGGTPEKLAEAVSSFDPVAPESMKALERATKAFVARMADKISKADPSISLGDAYSQAQKSKEAQAIASPTASFGLMRQAETGNQQAANMVADAQRKQVNSIVKVIRAHDSSIPISQAKAAAERRVADAWGGLYKRTKEQEQQASLLSRAMSRVTGLYSRIRGSDLTPEQRERRDARNSRISNMGMALAFTAPMIADQAGQLMGGTAGQGLSAATSTFSTYAAVGTQLASLGLPGIIAGFGVGLVGLVAAFDDYEKALQTATIEINKTKIEKESQKSEKSLATLAKDPKNAAATQDIINSLDVMLSSEAEIQKSNKELRKPSRLRQLGSFLTGGYYDSTTPIEVKENKEYQAELKKLNEENLSAAEFEVRQRKLAGKYAAQTAGEANAAQSRARADIAMQALSSKGSQGLTIDQALSSFGGNAGKIQESIAAGNKDYAVALEKLVQEAEAATAADPAKAATISAQLDKRKQALIQKYYLEETSALAASMADNVRAKAANKVAKALNMAVTSIDRTFGNMEAALGRGADALSQATSRLDAIAADRSNLQNTFAGQNVLENPRAYSRAERTRAVKQTAGFFGGDAKFVEKLTSTVGSDIKDSLTAIGVRAQANPGTSKEAVAQEIQRTVDQQLMAAFGNNDLTRQLSEQIRVQLEEQKSQDTKEIDIDQLIAASTGLTSLIDSEKKAFELLAQASKQATQALDLYSSKLVTATEMLNEVDNISAESISMRASNDFRLREMLGQGQKVSVGERIAARTREAAARAGIKPDQLNTAALVARLDSLRQSRTTMEQNRAAFQEGSSFNDPTTMEGINRFNAGLINLDNEIAKTKNALKNLPKDIQGAIDDVTAAMEDRLSKIEAKREAGAGFAERLVTSTPTELTSLNSTYTLLNNALSGQARTIQQSTAAQMAYQKIIQDGGTAVEAMTAAQAAYADENKQVFGLFNELVAVGGIDKQQANTMRADLLETMARSQGMNTQNNPLFNQIIANLRRKPEEDPEIARLKTLYQQLQETQQKAAEATRQLVIDDATNLIKAAGAEVKRAIETARISFNEQQLNDMGLGLSRPGQVMGQQQGGLIYASKGKLINFQPKGTDTVPAMLTPGEFVVNARATQQNLPLLQAINKSSGGPVQYFAAGTRQPVGMSRNAPNPFNNADQARNFFDSLMNTWGVPATGNITSNPAAKKPQTTTQTQAAVAPKPAVSSTPSGSMYTVDQDTGGVSRPFISGGIDYASLSPDDLLLEQKYLKQQLNLLKGPDGKITGFAVNEAKKLIASIQQINAYLPPDMRPAVTTAQAPAAAAANTAATPKPATQATVKPTKQTTAKPKATTAASKPTPTNFVYDPDNLPFDDAPSASDAKDVIAKRGSLMDYDSIQPDAGGTMRTTKPRAAGGGFGFGRFRLPSISSVGSLSGAGRLAMRAGSSVVGGIRGVGTSLIPALGLNAASEFLGFGSLSNEAITAGSIGFDALRGGLRAAYTAPSAFNAFAGPGGGFGGRIPSLALSNQAGRLTTANRFLPRVGNNVLNTRIPGTPNLPRFGGGSGIPTGGTASNFVTGARGAAASAIAVNTALSAVTEGVSFLSDREGYSNRLAAEEMSEYDNARDQSGIRYAVGQAVSGFLNPFRMFAKFGRAAYTANEASQQAAESSRDVQAKEAQMNARYQIKMEDGTLRAIGARGEQWVRMRTELEMERAKLENQKVTIYNKDPKDPTKYIPTESNEYQRRLANLEADRNAVDITEGWFGNTSTRRMSASNKDLDYAYNQAFAAREAERQKEQAEREAKRQKNEAEMRARMYESGVSAVATGIVTVGQGIEAASSYASSMWNNFTQGSARRKAEKDRKNVEAARKGLYREASETLQSSPIIPGQIEEFKRLELERIKLEEQLAKTFYYDDAGQPQVDKAERTRIESEIDKINGQIIASKDKASALPMEEVDQQWKKFNRNKQQSVVRAEKQEINDALRRKLGAYKLLDKVSRVPAPRDPERVPEWRAKTLERIRDKFNLSGNTEEDIKLMTAYGLSPELAKNLFRPLTEDQNQAAYEILSQQTQGSQYKYSDSDLNLLRISREELIKKITSGRVPNAEAILARKEKLETAREKEFAKALKAMGRIDSLAQRGMAANPRAQGGFREKLLKRLVKLGYVDPRESDAANAQRLSAFNLNANTVAFIYPAQVGGMLAGKVDNAQQKYTGGIVYASKGKLINFQPRGSDTVPAMLTPGEFVVNARATQQNLPLLQAINKAKGGQVSYFNTGGVPATNMSIGPAQSSNIRAQQQSLALQQKAAENINAMGVGVRNTNKIATDINNQQLPSLTNKADNYQDTNSKGIASIHDLSQQGINRTEAVASYLSDNDTSNKLDAILNCCNTNTGLAMAANALLMDQDRAAGNLAGLPREQRVGIAEAGEEARRGLGQMFGNMFFSRGGIVYASKGMMIPYQPRGTDTVPAMLTPGEFVVNRQSTKENLPLLQAINGGARGFSRGGQVNYMADGGLLGQLFAPLMGSFKGLTSSIGLAIQALQTYQKQLAATQPNSVSNTSGPRMNLDGLSEFTNKFDQFINALNKINIPPMVNLQVAPVTVNITGAEALVAALEGPLGGMLQQQIAVAMNRLSANSEGAIQA